MDDWQRLSQKIFKTPLACTLAFVLVWVIATSQKCDVIAFWIGLIFTVIVVKHRLGVVPLIISLCMMLCHLDTVSPVEMTLVYKGVKLPIFRKQTYILIYCDLFHERKLSAQMEQLLHSTEGCVIDAGAYVGDTFLLLARKHKHRTFYMIEPSQENADFIERVKSSNVRVIRRLVSDKKKQYQGHRENMANASYTESTQGIESCRVDDLIHEKVGIMHYDVEGMELEVVRGSMGLIRKHRPIVIVESLGRHKEKTAEIISLLKPLGYTSYTIDESCNEFDLLDKGKCRNHVFLPERRGRMTGN